MSGTTRFGMRIKALERGVRLGQVSPAPAAPVVDAGLAMRLLVLADGSKQVVDGALARASAPGATAADKAAAREVGTCLDALSKAQIQLDSLALELRESLASGRGARVSGEQAAALEAFAVCAAKASSAARSARAGGGLVEAFVGIGVPAAGALLAALWGKA